MQDPGASIYVRFNDGDPGPEVIAEFLALGCKVAPTFNNVGFGSGHTWAVDEMAPGQWIWIMNPDVELPQGWCRAAALALRDLPVDAALAGVPLTGQTVSADHAPTGRHALRLGMRMFGLGSKDSPWDGSSIRRTYTVPGCLFAMRSAQGHRLTFDARQFLFFEEQVLAEQARMFSLSAWLMPLSIAAHHQGGASRAGMSPAMRSFFIQSQSLYLHLYLSWPQVLCWIFAKITRVRITLSGGV